MIIEEHKEIDKQNITGDFKSIEAGIDESSMTFMFEMLSKSLYSNPIGSIVRELTSNCFDSHKEANVDKAVVINFKTDDEGDFISFQDFGVGLSTERIQTVYMKYFSSTKRGSNELIGGFGLGSKTPLSYTDYFYINTNYNGTSYQYIFSKGESKPTLDLLFEDITEECNGTEIKIYIKNNTDRNKFRNELLSQLCYFDNVYFNNWGINNDYKIYETETFKYRNQDQYNEEMHLILGKVAYPINWNELNIERVKIPVGIKFEIGELQVTPNRESLRYTDEAKILINDKIKLVIEELKSLYKDDTMLYDDWFEYLNNKNARPYILLGEEDKLYLTGLKESKAVFKPFYELGIDRDNYNLSYLLSHIYECIGRLDTVEKINERNIASIYNKFENESQIILSNNKQLINIRNLKFLNKYIFIKKKLNEDFVKLIGQFVIKGYENNDNINEPKFYKYFNLGISIKAYKVYKILEGLVSNLIVDYHQELTEEDNLKYKNYLLEKNKINIERKELGKFPVKDISLEFYGYNYQYDLQINYLNKFKGIIIYGYIEDEHKLKVINNFLHSFKDLKCYTKYYKNGKTFYKFNELIQQPANSYRYMNDKNCLNPNAVKILRIAKNNKKHFKGDNMVHIDEFSSDNRIFRKLATIFKIEKIVRDIFSSKTNYREEEIIEYFSKINETVGENLKALADYKDNFKLITPNNRANSQDYHKFKDEILTLAESNNWFDLTIIDKINFIEEWFKGIEIIKFIDFKTQSLPFILKYLYDNKRKINLEYYVTYVKPELLKGQLIIDFDAKEETETGLFKILKQVA